MKCSKGTTKTWTTKLEQLIVKVVLLLLSSFTEIKRENLISVFGRVGCFCTPSIFSEYLFTILLHKNIKNWIYLVKWRFWITIHQIWLKATPRLGTCFGLNHNKVPKSKVKFGQFLYVRCFPDALNGFNWSAYIY